MDVKRILSTIIAASTKTANGISLELGRDRSFVRLTKSHADIQLRTLADIADVCDMDVVIIDRKTGEQICKVDAPRAKRGSC